jgi:hypothetical protein
MSGQTASRKASSGTRTSICSLSPSGLRKTSAVAVAGTSWRTADDTLTAANAVAASGIPAEWATVDWVDPGSEP